MNKIAVIGSINMDMTASVSRIPSPGETVSAGGVQYLPGGKGANQAVAAARLGGDVTMFGCVGTDTFGGPLIENLKKNGVQTGHIEAIDGESSGLAMIFAADNDNAITVIAGANSCVTPAYIDRHQAAILEADIVLLQNEIPMETVEYAAHLLHSAGKTVIYNPAPAKPATQDLLENATYLTPNEHEVRIVFADNHTPIEDMVVRQNGKLIVTLGEKGAAGCADGQLLQISALQANVVDTTGAGDTCNGALAYALSQKMPLSDALRFANAAAGLSTEGAGAQGAMPGLEAVEQKLNIR